MNASEDLRRATRTKDAQHLESAYRAYVERKYERKEEGSGMMIFLTVLATIFIAEMGDKTQLLLVAMAGKHKISHILTGTWLATAVLNLMAVGLGAALGSFLDMRIIKSAAALAFFWFAYNALKSDGGDEEEKEVKSKFGPVIGIFTAFFIGELGDKTQLSAITLAAAYTNHNIGNACYVFLGCTLGLILADFLGLVVGVVLNSRLPAGILNKLSFLIFAFFGVDSLRIALGLIFGENHPAASALLVILTAVFVLLCAAQMVKRRTADQNSAKRK